MLHKIFLILIGTLLSIQTLAGASTLYAVSPYSGDSTNDGGLMILDPITGIPTSAIDITYNGNIILGANGLAIDPTTGIAYAIIKASTPPLGTNSSMQRSHKRGQNRGGGSNRSLVTLDLNTGVATLIANLGDNFAGITFDCTGQMYGVTGDGATVSETAYLIDKTTASTTLLATLGDGSDGETIGFNTNNGLLYTRSGRNTNSAFTSIDPSTGATSAIGGTTLDEAFSMLWDSDNNYFLEANLDQEWLSTETNGTQTILDPTGYPGYYKGLAWVPVKGCIAADLSITKTDGVTSAVSGTSLTYTIVASNAGPNDDPTVTVSDTFPADLSCSYTSIGTGGATGNTNGSGNLTESLNMPSGSSVTYTATCDIASNATGTLSNTATILGSLPDPQTGNNSATDNDTVLTAEADLSIVLSGPGNVTTPGAITYNVDVTNSGPSDATNVIVTDVLGVNLFSVTTVGCLEDPNGYPNCSLGTLTSGAMSSYTISFEVGSIEGSIDNSVSVASDVIDPTPANNAAINSILGTPIVIPTFSFLGLTFIILTLFVIGLFSTRGKRL